MKKVESKHEGYIALASVLVIGVVVLTIIITSSLLAISEAQLSLAELRKNKTIDFVESCAEDALIALNKLNTLPNSLTIPEGTCTVSSISQAGNNWTFTIYGAQETHGKTIQITALRDSTITILSWKEL